ncbi:hypothetical protein A7P95_00385 [Eikenella longinqua]|uniref:Uncharacterized protein n=1 Tax=Eikenella longinqua TaxID=1795827 RepID=A0A1A9S3K2_9NEIS|nr:hypothetical protein [Eikenella longinqua]OAM31521.1 hypothetical protein A7P95_00385 [Eikenella longinqua]
MQGKPDWKKYRQQAAEKLRRLKQKPQLLAAAAIFSGSLLLAIGLLAGNGGKQQAPAPRPAPQASAPAETTAEGGIATVSAPIDLVTPEVADDHAIDDPLTAAEANPEPEHALPPATAQSMNPACESYFQRARACFRRAPEDQAEALLQSLEATRGDLAQLDAEGCEVVNRQFGEMVQQMGCEKTQAEAKPDEHKSPGASAPRAR